tara:strand:- start:26962 stop:28413 length:1452 start_codon:yes stop_codon:yes gene_type:complete
MSLIKTLYLAFFILLSSTLSAINLVIDYATFYAEKDDSYVEFYLLINGNSVNYANTEGDLFQGNIEVTYILEEAERVAAFDKFLIKSPLYKLEDFKQDLIDLKRFSLKNGNYTLSFQVVDLITKDTVSSKFDLREINYHADQFSISDIQLVNELNQLEGETTPFVKSGLEVIPNFSHNYGPNLSELHFYAELYNSTIEFGEDQAFLIEYAIVNEGTEKVVANLRHAKRQKTADISPLLFSFNIDQLPSGKYDLLINAKNRENELIKSKRVNFFRLNPNLTNYANVHSEQTFVDSLNDINLLREYIKSLYPISSHAEIQFAENQLAYADLNFMQQYFLNFWKTRNPTEPEREWLLYKEQVMIVNEMFGYGNVKGYTTERGRVFLQYGPPDAMQDVPYEPDTYPYSIWQYAKLQGLTDRKFVFYSPSMEMLGYQVLHSNVRGEIFNPGWEADLISGSNMNRRGNREDPGNTIINDRARDLFNNPR